MRLVRITALGVLASAFVLVACSSSNGNANSGGAGASGVASSTAGAPGVGGDAIVGTAGNASAGAGGSLNAGAAGSAGSGGSLGTGTAGVGNLGSAGSNDMPGVPASMTQGWLYTAGSKIYVSNGSAPGTQWVGRGVNVDDLFFCGYNYKLETSNAEALLKTEMEGLFSAWKPSFVRMSLGMDSYPTKASWLADDTKYKTPMINVIRAIGAHPNTYVLVTLRSDVTMIGQDPGDAEPTGMPSDATNTPDKTLYPRGTDPVYEALVDTFAHDHFVLFGITNEAGGNRASADEISAAMSHAVATIRAEEDRLGVPHHLVSVQGSGYSGNIAFYDTKPLTQDNVVYEEHAYPPVPGGYTYTNIPVILGEYGNLDSAAAAAFFQDVETKKIPSLAWDFDPYSNCAPDLLDITQDASMLNASDWGKLVQGYLTSHATP